MCTGRAMVFLLDWIYGVIPVQDLGEFEAVADETGPFSMDNKTVTLCFEGEKIKKPLDPVQDQYWERIHERVKSPGMSSNGRQSIA